jgi:acetoin utilization deacetylase AcuC-like enzyme
MRGFFDRRQRAHAPATELHNGGFVPYAETPERADAILAALGPLDAPADHGEAPILAVHDPDYVDFLKTAPARWAEAGRPGDVLGYIWPIVARRPLTLDRIDALAGRYSLDASTPLTADTWTSAYWSAQTALSALDAVRAGDRAAFALCRPPGHHAGRDYLGGYCHLNTAAIAAEAAIADGAKRVAILDIDYHHGNGTQDIFYERADVLTVSIHGHPRVTYPYFSGFEDETGAGRGAGANLNLPLQEGIGEAEYTKALERALGRIAKFAPAFLVVSLGLDIARGDPTGSWLLRAKDFRKNGALIGGLNLPTLVVQEGGYRTRTLGVNARNFFEGLWEATTK